MAPFTAPQCERPEPVLGSASSPNAIEPLPQIDYTFAAYFVRQR
jgi:hypothetical protein